MSCFGAFCNKWVRIFPSVDSLQSHPARFRRWSAIAARGQLCSATTKAKERTLTIY